MTQGDIESKENCSSANDGGDDFLIMSDSDYEGSENEETDLPPEFFRYTQKNALRMYLSRHLSFRP